MNCRSCKYPLAEATGQRWWAGFLLIFGLLGQSLGFDRNFKYDLLGRRTLARDAQVTKIFEYDDLDRLRSSHLASQA